jgi:hypothetical protein
VRGGIDGDGDGLTGCHRAGSQINGKLQPFPVKASTRGSCQLRRLRSNSPQTHGRSLAQQNAHQAGVQQNPQAFRNRLGNRGSIGDGMHCLDDFHQGLRTAMLFLRYLSQTARFQQTAELASKDRRFGRQIVVEVVRFRNVQEDGGPDYFI